MRVRTVMAGLCVAVISIAAISVLAQPPGGRQGPAGRFPLSRLPLMQALDTDNDGQLSAAEIAAASQALKKLDKNGDGMLQPEELAPQFRQRRSSGGRGPGRPPASSSARGPQGSLPENEPLPKDEAERKVLQGIERILQTQGWRMNVPRADGRMLRLLVEAIGAKKVVEFGTSNGISAIWMAMALRKTGGKLITHEIDPETAALARKNFADVGVADIVTVVEGDAHKTAANLEAPIDLVFIDADKEGYLDYYQKTLPLVRPGGLICAHNINPASPRRGTEDFVKAITTDPNVETVFYLQGGGMSITLKKR